MEINNRYMFGRNTEHTIHVPKIGGWVAGRYVCESNGGYAVFEVRDSKGPGMNYYDVKPCDIKE